MQNLLSLLVLTLLGCSAFDDRSDELVGRAGADASTADAGTKDACGTLGCPEVVASGLTKPWRVALAPDGMIFWTDTIEGTVSWMAQSDTRPNEIERGVVGLGGIAAATGMVAYCSPSIVTTFATTTGERTSFGAPSTVQEVGWAGEFLAWSGPDFVQARRLSEPPRNIGTVEMEAHGLATLGTKLYWTVGAQQLTVRTTDLTSGADQASTVFTRDDAHALMLAVDGEYVYWLDDTAKEVRRRRHIMGDRPEIISRESSVEDAQLAVDERFVYWTLPQSGTVKRANKVTSELEVLAMNQDYPTSIAVSADVIVWANTRGGALMRLPKR